MAAEAFSGMSGQQQQAAVGGAVGLSLGAAFFMSPRLARMRQGVQSKLAHYFRVWNGDAYGKSQRKEMLEIHAWYQQCFGRNPNGGLVARGADGDGKKRGAAEHPPVDDQFRCLLAMDEDGRLVHFSGDSKLFFMASHWVGGMGRGLLRVVLEPVVQRICLELADRLSGRLHRRSARDPVSVVLSELNVLFCEWTHETEDAFRVPPNESMFGCDKDSRKTVVARTVDFLRALDTKVYSASGSHALPKGGNEIFRYIIRVLEGSVPAMLKQCERSYQLKSYIDSLLRAQRMALLHLVDYLWFVLREPAAGVANDMYFDPRVFLAAHQAVFERDVNQRVDYALDVNRRWLANANTITGYMLLQLTCSRPFHSLFGDWFRPLASEQLAAWNPQLRDLLGVTSSSSSASAAAASAAGGAPAAVQRSGSERAPLRRAAADPHRLGTEARKAGDADADSMVFMANPFTSPAGRPIVPQMRSYAFFERIDCSPLEKPLAFFDACADAAHRTRAVPPTGLPSSMLKANRKGETADAWSTDVSDLYTQLHGLALDVGAFATTTMQASAVAALGAEVLLLGSRESVEQLEKAMKAGGRLLSVVAAAVAELGDRVGSKRPPRMPVSDGWEANVARAADAADMLEQDVARANESVGKILALCATRQSEHMADVVRDELLVFMAMSEALNVRVARHDDVDDGR